MSKRAFILLALIILIVSGMSAAAQEETTSDSEEEELNPEEVTADNIQDLDPENVNEIPAESLTPEVLDKMTSEQLAELQSDQLDRESIITLSSSGKLGKLKTEEFRTAFNDIGGLEISDINGMEGVKVEESDGKTILVDSRGNKYDAEGDESAIVRIEDGVVHIDSTDRLKVQT
ncbi:MAG: hypothetical protein R6U32_01820, partial [Candidatus Woesearchaeota archaeon]